ncbi:hypothetical protein HYV86_02770 [Candidatus Woesearchaeota archaeon]|nr:hypothetical protein [Candidatus Woesearchaeota archaeon]
MGLDNVKNEIVEQAQAEADRVVADARSQASEILAKTREEIKQYKEQTTQRTSQLLDSMERKTLGAARFEAQRREMNLRTQLVQDLKTQVRDHILSLNKTEKQKFLTMLLVKARKEIDVATVYVNKQDEGLMKGSVKVVAKDIAGGLIAETADGKVSVNYSIEELLSHLMETKGGELNEVLFSND